MVVEGHLTYPEYRELCYGKEGGNARHDVPKPEGCIDQVTSGRDKEKVTLKEGSRKGT